MSVLTNSFQMSGKPAMAVYLLGLRSFRKSMKDTGDKAKVEGFAIQENNHRNQSFQRYYCNYNKDKK